MGDGLERQQHAADVTEIPVERADADQADAREQRQGVGAHDLSRGLVDEHRCPR